MLRVLITSFAIRNDRFAAVLICSNVDKQDISNYWNVTVISYKTFLSNIQVSSYIPRIDKSIDDCQCLFERIRSTTENTFLGRYTSYSETLFMILSLSSVNLRK